MFTDTNKKVLKVSNFYICLTKVNAFWLVGLTISFFLLCFRYILPEWTILKLFKDTEAYIWAIAIYHFYQHYVPLSFSSSLLVVLPKYVSEHKFSGHFTKYLRSCLCSSFVWSFISNKEPNYLLLYMCCDAWFSGNNPFHGEELICGLCWCSYNSLSDYCHSLHFYKA